MQILHTRNANIGTIFLTKKGSEIDGRCDLK